MLKRLTAFLFLCLASPLILIARIVPRSQAESVFTALGCWLSLVPGKTGSYLRVAFYRGTLESMHPEVRIGFGSYFSKPSARVGKGTFIGGYCILGNVQLGEQVLVASRVSVTSGRHQHGDSAGLQYASNTMNSVTIGDRTWLGEGSIVLASVGNDSIVGAGAVVVQDIPADSLAVGNPAKPRPR